MLQVIYFKVLYRFTNHNFKMTKKVVSVDLERLINICNLNYRVTLCFTSAV